MSEKRVNPRFACSRGKEYRIVFDDADKPAHLSNFSRDGLSIKSNDPLNADEIYDFSIAGDGLKASLPCQARVIWVQNDPGKSNYSCGAKIIKMEPCDKIDLIEILYQDWKNTVNQK